MSLETLKDTLPDYAKDVRMNVSSINTVATMTPQQLWGTVLASAIATRNKQVIAAAYADAAPKLTAEALTAAKTAASLMAMNNVYYRFVHLVGSPDYKTMPARLRMSAIGNPGVDKLDFELWSLAVSAINGCGMCIESHEHEVLQKGAGRETVQDAVRIAAIVQSLAVTLESEEVLSAGSLAAAA